MPKVTGAPLMSTFQVEMPLPPKQLANEKPMDEVSWRRVINNRQSQRRFRVKRQNYIKELETKAQQLDDAQNTISVLTKERDNLMQRIAEMERVIAETLGASPTFSPMHYEQQQSQQQPATPVVAESAKSPYANPTIWTPPSPAESDMPTTPNMIYSEVPTSLAQFPYDHLTVMVTSTTNTSIAAPDTTMIFAHATPGLQTSLQDNTSECLPIDDMEDPVKWLKEEINGMLALLNKPGNAIPTTTSTSNASNKVVACLS